MNTKLALLTLLLLTYPTVAQTSPAAKAARQYRQQHEHEIMAEYTRLLAIPNVASDLPNIRRNAALITEMLQKRGVKTQLLELP